MTATEKKTEKAISKNIHQRLHAAMKKVEYVQKEDKKQGIQYRFVSHDAVTAAVRPHLVEEGVIYYPQNMVTKVDGNRTEANFDVRFVNVDDPSDYIDVPTFGYGIDQQDKGPGKAISYGVKYALLKALGLETGDDPERDSISHEPESKAAPAKIIPLNEDEFWNIKDGIAESRNNAELDIAKEKAVAARPRMTDDQFRDVKAIIANRRAVFQKESERLNIPSIHGSPDETAANYAEA